MRRLDPVKTFAVKLLLLVVCLEAVMRVCSHQHPEWYRLAVRNLQKDSSGRLRYLFIGSSRVANAVLPDEFSAARGDGGTALNLATGYSTLAEHYFGLRRLALARPDGLKGVVVFLEAPGGMPEMASWQEDWLNPDNPDLLVATIGVSDLRAFWTLSGSGIGDKVYVTAASLSEVLARRHDAGMLLEQVRYLAGKIQDRIVPRQSDLSPAGGTRTDQAGIRNSRRLALKYAAEAIARQQPFSLRPGDRLILKDLRDMVAAGGGTLVLFDMPVSSVLAQVQDTPLAHSNRLAIQGLLAGWGIPVIHPDILTDDSDFPDSWHLRESRAAEFSRCLADAFREYDRPR